MATFRLRRSGGGSALRSGDAIRQSSAAGATLEAAGTGTFKLSATASPTAVVWVYGQSWTTDESGKARVVLSAYASASLLVPVTAPPAGSTTTAIRRVSITMPAPVLDAQGRPT